METRRVYNLTNLTRNANANRRVVIQGIDIPARGLLIAGLAAIPAFIATVIAWMIVGELGVIMLPVVELAAFWLIETRSRSGLRLRRYQTFYDQHRSLTGTFVCCGAAIDPLHGTWATVAASSVPSMSSVARSGGPDIDEAFRTVDPIRKTKSSRPPSTRLPHGDQ